MREGPADSVLQVLSKCKDKRQDISEKSDVPAFLVVLIFRDLCASICITKKGDFMFIQIDYDSEEAIYVQLQNQIIMSIATDVLREGDSLPSVRQMAEIIGINMHTVNKAYTILKQDGFIQLGRRGAIIAIDADKAKALMKMRERLQIVLAKGYCKNISRQEVHALVDDIFDEYGRG